MALLSAPAPLTNTGESLCAGDPREPSPIWPLLFKPQAATVPSSKSAKPWLEPAAMAFASLPESAPVIITACGNWLPYVVPLPSWPKVLMPQEATVPSEQSARL